MTILAIDTRQGTDNSGQFSNGNCLPYTGVPFGMNYVCPQTNSDERWWFNPNNRVFQGFRITHQPSPWMGDFSSLLILPVAGIKDVPERIEAAQSSYKPENSTFSPIKTRVFENRYRLTATMIPSCYGGILTIDSEQVVANGVLIKLPRSGKLSLSEDGHSLTGFVSNFAGSEDQNLTFYLSFYSEHRVVSLSQEDELVLVTFEPGNSHSLKFGTSFLSAEQAQLNLDRELSQDSEEYEAASQKEWDDLLGKVKISHRNPKEVSTFYHNLYRTFLFPQRFFEVDRAGQKVHYDTISKTVKAGVLYTNNGYWDTYKTVYPLFSILIPEVFEDMMVGILNFYKDTGFLPRWTSPDERGLMPGTLVDAVLADGVTKGIGKSLASDILKAMEDNASKQPEDPKYGRSAISDYKRYGYVPENHRESVNETLDYAYSDFCIGQVAQKLGDHDKAATYFKQAKNYQNLFDSASGFMRAKGKNGQFKDGFDAYHWGTDYAEGSAWQSSFSVYQDFAGLIEQYGGVSQFDQKITDLFNQKPWFKTFGYGMEIHEMSEMADLELGQFALSNQPSFHYPFLFSYIGKPEKTQPLLKMVLKQLFNDSYQGFPGDEDNGSMAAWYVFNSLGFYPVTPGSGQYVIGMPLYDRVQISLPKGKELTIQTNPNEDYNLFLKAVTVNGKANPHLYLTHEELVKGGSIEFELGNVPVSRDYVTEDLPFSLTKATVDGVK